VNIFAIKIELWQIGDSPMAPKFHIVSQPNDWAKALKKYGGQQSELSETRLLQLEFWTQFKSYATSNETTMKLRKPQPQHWMDMAYGVAEAQISLTINTQSNSLGCEIYIFDLMEMYNHYFSKKETIEEELEEHLEWMELPGKKASRIKLSREGDVTNKDSWETYFDWFINKAEDFQKVFYKHRLI
jgi:hypothetical protein